MNGRFMAISDIEHQKLKVFSAYEGVGKLSSLYDEMMTGSSLLGKFALRFFWGLSDKDYRAFLRQAYAGVSRDFSGRLLEVPIGTGVLSLPLYKDLPASEIVCVDYSRAMLNVAVEHAAQMNLSNVKFLQGDVGALPFEDEYFDLVVSVDGFHAFPDKEAAYRETFRVLRRGGIFCGCMYVIGENCRTDFFVKHFCDRRGFFTPMHETLVGLERRLDAMYRRVEISNVKSFAGFICTK